MASSARSDALLDLGALVTLAALIGWVAVAGRVAGARPEPVIGLLVAVGAAYAVARVASSVHDWAVPAVVTVVALGVAVWYFDTLSARPLGGPLGYSNATGAFYLQAAAAAVMVAVRGPAGSVRQGAVTLAVAFAAVPWVNGTDTAAALVLALVLVGAVAAGRLQVRTVLAFSAATAVAVLAVTVGLGATYGPDRSGLADRALDATLSERRPALWHDALVLLRSEPLTGVGPGRFGELGSTARTDADAAWAHHELAELGAETGLPGVVLALALVAFAFAVLWRGPRDAATAAAGVALAALVIHSSVDYVLHFPAVGLAAAAVAGAGRARPVPDGETHTGRH